MTPKCTLSSPSRNICYKILFCMLIVYSRPWPTKWDQKKFETYLGRGGPHLFENHEFLIFSACGHVQADQEPTRKLFSLLFLWFLVNFYLYFQKIVDFVTFLVCSQCIELWNWDFHQFSASVVSGRFSWPLKSGSDHSENLSFDFLEYYSRWIIGKPAYRLFMRISFEF